MESFCELIAAMKLRTTNLKGRHLSTGRAIELLVEPGIETPNGLAQVQPGLLIRSVNRYLRAWGAVQVPPLSWLALARKHGGLPALPKELAERVALFDGHRCVKPVPVPVPVLALSYI